MVKINLKYNFFDRQVVIDAMDAKTHEALYRNGNSIKIIAQRSMRYRKKASAAGSAPSAHNDTKRGPLLRKLLTNEFDTSSKTQLIGPQGRGKAAVPVLQEAGGNGTVTVFAPSTARAMSPAAKAAFRRKVLAGAVAKASPSTKITRSAHFPARPYMGPGLRIQLPKMPKEWAGQLRRA